MSFGHGSFCQLPFCATGSAEVPVVPPVVPPVVKDPAGGSSPGLRSRFHDPFDERLRKREIDIAVASLMYLRAAAD